MIKISNMLVNKSIEVICNIKVDTTESIHTQSKGINRDYLKMEF